jgi:hypothetical protein
MKRIATTIMLLICITSISALAQNDRPQKNGIRIGYHAASMVKDGSKPEESKTPGKLLCRFF